MMGKKLPHKNRGRSLLPTTKTNKKKTPNTVTIAAWHPLCRSTSVGTRKTEAVSQIAWYTAILKAARNVRMKSESLHTGLGSSSQGFLMALCFQRALIPRALWSPSGVLNWYEKKSHPASQLCFAFFKAIYILVHQVSLAEEYYLRNYIYLPFHYLRFYCVQIYTYLNV